MRTTRDGLKNLIVALGWEPEYEATGDLLSQLAGMVEVSDGRINVKEPPSYVAKVGRRGYLSVIDAAKASAGRTVRLVSDLTTGFSVPAGTNLTLDLNGHSITTFGPAINNAGRLTIIGVGTIESTNDYAIGALSRSVTTIVSGTIKSVEGAVITGRGIGATVNVLGGTLSASDNAVLAGNGSAGGGGNTFNVLGGRIEGAIKTGGYVACGIYCPNDDHVNVSGGEFHIVGGCGICSRAGIVKVTGGSFDTTGDAVGRVGDSRVVVPCSAVVFDSGAAYPALSDNDVVRVIGGTYKSEAGPVAFVGPVPHITVQGGTFSGEVPESCVASGFSCKRSGEEYVVVRG